MVIFRKALLFVIVWRAITFCLTLTKVLPNCNGLPKHCPKHNLFLSSMLTAVEQLLL